jgi:hypothetical protein
MIMLGAWAAEASRAYKARPDGVTSFAPANVHPVLSVLGHLGFIALVVVLGSVILAALTRPPSQD